jgi:hypothetical protein
MAALQRAIDDDGVANPVQVNEPDDGELAKELVDGIYCIDTKGAGRYIQ